MHGGKNAGGDDTWRYALAMGLSNIGKPGQGLSLIDMINLKSMADRNKARDELAGAEPGSKFTSQQQGQPVDPGKRYASQVSIPGSLGGLPASQEDIEKKVATLDPEAYDKWKMGQLLQTEKQAIFAKPGEVPVDPRTLKPIGPAIPEQFKPINMQRPGTRDVRLARTQKEFDALAANGFAQAGNSVPGPESADTQLGAVLKEELIKKERTDAADKQIARESAAQDAYNAFTDTKDLTDRILNNPNLPKILGPVDSRSPDVSENSVQAASDIDTLKSQLAMNALNAARQGSAVGATGFGALNKEELNLVMAKISSLNRGLGEEDFKARLRDINSYMERARNNINASRVKAGLPALVESRERPYMVRPKEGSATNNIAPGSYDWHGPGKIVRKQ